MIKTQQRIVTTGTAPDDARQFLQKQNLFMVISKPSTELKDPRTGENYFSWIKDVLPDGETAIYNQAKVAGLRLHEYFSLVHNTPESLCGDRVGKTCFLLTFNQPDFFAFSSDTGEFDWENPHSRYIPKVHDGIEAEFSTKDGKKYKLEIVDTASCNVFFPLLSLETERRSRARVARTLFFSPTF